MDSVERPEESIIPFGRKAGKEGAMAFKTYRMAGRALSLFLLIVLFSATAHARIIYVDDDANGLNDGSSWINAYNDLQDALADANSSDKPVEIRVGQGTYEPAPPSPPPLPPPWPLNPGALSIPEQVDLESNHGGEIQPGDRSASFQLINGVSIRGGYAGCNESEPNARDIVMYETILSGKLDWLVNSFHVITSIETDTTAVLDGFTITEGLADGNDHHSCGAGMFNFQGSPTINKCTFKYNLADSKGGGMYNEQSSPIMTNCNFIGNMADQGGAVSNFNNSEPVVTNCTFTENVANDGGALYNVFAVPVLTSCILWNNSEFEIEGSAIVIFSDVNGGWPGLGNIDADPCFVQLGILGTYPLPKVGNEGDYRLRPGSPCIDTGDPSYIATPNETDLYGQPRVVAGRIDMGACEFQPPRILYVDDDANGANDGSTWADAYNDLQDALAVAGAGDEIRVGQGTYKPGPPIDPIPPLDPWELLPIDVEVLTATFQLKNAVVIKGGYAGFGQPVPNARDIYTYYTVLSGDLAGNDEKLHDPCDLINDPCRADNTYNVVTSTRTDGSAVLDGFIITGGGGRWYIGDDLINWGGGILIDDGSPTVRNCVFRENRAGYGGGMFNFGKSSPKVTNCTFNRNAVSYEGGGVYYSRGMSDGDWIASPTFTNCNFSENWGGMSGGGMYNEYSEPVITDCRFNWNRVHSYGGGMANIGCHAKLTNCKFVANLVQYQSNLIPFFTPVGGGAMYNDGGAPSIINCTFAGNCSMWYAIGGAVLNSNSDPAFAKCTFTGNQNTSISCDSWKHGSPSNVQISNCILWNSGNEIQNKDESILTVTYSDIEGGWPGEGNINTDPCFVQPGWFSFSRVIYGYYNLLPDSMCIDAGDPNYAAGLDDTDLDGRPRVVDGRIDMGAYEFQGPRDPCVFYVDDDAIGVNNGSSWDDAFNFLQDALIEAQYGDTILMAQGMYKPDMGTAILPGDSLDSFRLKNGVVIKGGYGGFTEQNPDFRNIDIYKTILTGDIGEVGYKDDNSYHVLMSSGTDATTVLDGFTVTGGRAERMLNESDFWMCGGGMFSEDASPTLLNCTFTENSAWFGGGLYIRGGSPTVTDCTFSDNSAVGVDFWLGRFHVQCGNGGGMRILGGVPILTNCRFSSNMTGNNGGGLYNSHYSPMITSCIFSGNSADSQGGGMYSVSSSRAMLTSCTFSGNVALENGGGISCDEWSSDVLTSCLFSGNVATVNGGGIYNYRSSPVLNNCTLSDNWAGSYGGGICNEGSDANLTNCIFWGDSALQGSEIYVGRYIDYKGTEYPSTMDVNYSSIGSWDTNIFVDTNCTLNWGIGNIDVDPCFIRPGFWQPSLPPRPAQASNPDPFDGMTSLIPTVDLSWMPCVYATSHNVYFGTNNPPPFVCNQTSVTFDPGMMDYNTKYYWRIDELNISGITTGDVWSFMTGSLPDKASNPYPADYATNVSIDVDLNWTAGFGATSHDVYFGTYNPPPFICNQTATTFDAGTLDYDLTYYWHIGEVNDLGITTGDIWRFTTQREQPPPPPLVTEAYSYTSDTHLDYVWIDGDYHLFSESPCIDAGDPNYIAEPNEMDLDGRPRIIGCRVDMGAYEYNPPVLAEVDIDPSTLNLNNKGRWITTFIRLPEEYNVADIDPNSILLEAQIEPERFWLTEDELIAIAKFDRERVQAYLAVGEIELTITGQLTDGTAFEAKDVIKVIDKGGKK